MTVAKSRTKKKLKLFTGEAPKAVRPQIDAVASLPEVLRAFRQTTGWSLEYLPGPAPAQVDDLSWSSPVNPGVGTTPGHLRLTPWEAPSDQKATKKGSGAKAVDAQTARSLASSLSELVSELLQTRHLLWQREAELAAGVPLIPHAEESQHLARRLEAVLRGGAEAVGAQSAALYLLDEATTHLKLRSCWGLPFDRMTVPARPLQGAVADLEALLGHAVVMRDAETMGYWKVPETCGAAVCVPVSTPTTLLGTFWIFCDETQDFSDRQTNLLEMVAGRLAADLEREMLLREGVDSSKLKKQITAAERLQRNQLPTISPLLDNWEVAGFNTQAEALGGDFYDWFCLPNGLLAVAVGDAMEQGIDAALSGNALKAALRAHGQYHREPQETLKQLNLTHWTGSAGDQYAALFFGLIETATGRINYSVAGQPAAIVVGNKNWQSLSRAYPPLGESPEADYDAHGHQLQPGEVLVVFSDGVRDAIDEQGRLLGESGVAETLLGQVDRPAEELVALLRGRVENHGGREPRDDQTILVIKHQRP